MNEWKKKGINEWINIHFLSLDTFFTSTHSPVEQSYCRFSIVNFVIISNQPDWKCTIRTNTPAPLRCYYCFYFYYYHYCSYCCYCTNAILPHTFRQSFTLLILVRGEIFLLLNQPLFQLCLTSAQVTYLCFELLPNCTHSVAHLVLHGMHLSREVSSNLAHVSLQFYTYVTFSASCPVPSAHISVFNSAVVALNSLLSSLNWSIITCNAERILNQYSLYPTSWQQMSPDGLFFQSRITMFIRLLPPAPLAVTINTTHSPLCLPHRTSPPKSHLTIPITHAQSCSLFSDRLHSHTTPVPTRLLCPFFLVPSRFVARTLWRQDVTTYARSHAARSNSPMLQYLKIRG